MIFILIDKFDDDPKSGARKLPAIRSQDDLFENGAAIPILAWPESYSRNATTVLGDKRQLPFLKDLFQKFLDASSAGDICLWINDDSICHALIAEYAAFHCSVFGCCSFFRSEFRGKLPSLDLTPEQLGKSSDGTHIGRDAFSFSREWLVAHVDKIPDFCLGAEGWDLCMSAIVRLSYGIKTTKANLGDQIFPAEPPRGYVAHVAHDSIWHSKQFKDSPSNEWNKRLFVEWAAKHLPDLKFSAQNTL